MGRQGVNDRVGFTKFLGQIGSNKGMGTFNLMVNGLTDVVQQAGSSGLFHIQAQLRGHDSANKTHLS